VQIRSATLIGQRTTERWEAEPGSDALSAEQAVLDTAEWIRDRLSETRSAKRLDTLCLDIDGAACSWIRGRDAETELIRSAIDGAGAEIDEDDLHGGHSTAGIAERLPALGRELDVDVLGTPDASGRAAVLAAPDAPARLLLDRLDALGVRVGRVVTLWHTIAEAWDPGAHRASESDHAGIVATDHPPAAVVLIDPESGRLIWSWSRQGELIACGSMRVRRLRSEKHESHAEVLEHDIARLAGDWLGWSAQLGVCPTRVVVVGNPAPGGMSPGEIGRALTRAWGGSMADLIPSEDPIGDTLGKTLDVRPINAFQPLAERPTRSHRAAYRWLAVVLLIAAACVAGLGVGLFNRASGTKDVITQVNQERMDALNAVAPELVLDPFPAQRLSERIAVLQRRTGDLDVDAPRPIMSELETISLVLAIPGVSVDLIEVLDTLVTIKVRVREIGEGERLDQALNSIGGSGLRWRDPSYDSRGNDQISVVYTATWPERTARTP